MSRALRAALGCGLVALIGCGGRIQQAERRLPSPGSTRPDVPAALTSSEAALGLTRRLPPEYVEACLELLREMDVSPCPPLVPDGAMSVRGWGDSLDVTSGVLSAIDGQEIDAHGGHWTIWVARDKGGRKVLADHMHAAGAKAPSQCRFLELAGQRVEACKVPPYPDGGYYGNHIAYAWQRGDIAYNVTLHNHANEPRLQLMMAALIVRETSPRVRPRFETATVTPCAVGRDERDPGPGSTGSDSEKVSSGRVTLTCRTVESLAATAYVQYASGLGHSRWATGKGGTLVTGGPSWIRSERYTIDAPATPTSTTAHVLGPMLQTLLEDRFALKVRYETRDVPVYRLNTWWVGVQGVARPSLKAEPFQEGRCVPLDPAREDFGPAGLAAGERWCAAHISHDEAFSRLAMEGATLDDFSRFLSVQPFVGRRVVNRTPGIRGRFDFHLEFQPRPERLPTASANARPSLFTAMQEQLGLALEPAREPARFLVVERVARPSEAAPRTGEHVTPDGAPPR